MACLDLRSDSGLGKFLSNKLVSIILGFIQLVWWTYSLLDFIIRPVSTEGALQSAKSVLAALIILVTVLVVFSVLLLIGLFKKNKCFIKSYLIFNGLITVFFIVIFLVLLFLIPKEIGVWAFFGLFTLILGKLLYFFVIRYYLLSLNQQR